VLGSPVYLIVTGPLVLIGVPVVTVLAGPWLWPGKRRSQLAGLGLATAGSLLFFFLLAVFPFYGLCAPTGAWRWVGLTAAPITYAPCCLVAVRRPWWWPLVVAASLAVSGSVGAVAAVAGVGFEC
jgi:hypothetical protein